MEQTFLQRRLASSKHMKAWLTLAIVREMQIKTTRYSHIPVRMAMLKNKRHQVLTRLWRKTEPLYTFDGDCCKHYVKTLEISQKIKVDVPYI
jgi:hypothetical protein